MGTDFATAAGRGEDGQDVARSTARDAVSNVDADVVDFCQLFCSPAYDLEGVLAGVRSVVGTDAALVGCTSAGEFTERGSRDGSVTLALVASDDYRFFTGMGTGLEVDVDACVDEAVAALPDQVDGFPHLSAINLHDGLAGVGEQIAFATQRSLGQHVGFAGGSAGDDMQLEATHVFCDDRIARDAVAIALVASKEPVPITVDHGHEPVSDPVEVTRASQNVVHELDGHPAFEVWLDSIAETAMDSYGIDVDDVEPGGDEFERLLNIFEFGIDLGTGYKIRWPGLTETSDGPITFPVNIPTGTVFRVMHSPPDRQIQSVVRATREALDEVGDREIAGGFVYDCVCRSAILGDDFDESIDAITDTLDAPFAGFETYGEMCIQRGQLGGYHNTTSVVVLLPD